MSRKIIRKTPKAKKPKGIDKQDMSMRDVRVNQLRFLREKAKSTDDKIVEDMIDNEILDIELRGDYQYILKVAKGLGWSYDRLKKSVNRTNMKKMRESIQAAIKEKKKTEKTAASEVVLDEMS